MSNEKTNHFPSIGPGAKVVIPGEGNRVQLLTDGTGSSPFNASKTSFCKLSISPRLV